MQLMLKRINQYLANKSQSFILVVGLLLVMLIGLLDYVTGKDFELDFFYLLPLFVVTWFASAEWAIATAVLVTLVWAIVDKATGQISPIWATDIWNTAVELAFFLTTVGLLLGLKRDARELEALANEDSLTGVANRRSFYRVAEAEMNRSQRFGSPFSFVYIDIDNFKAINDTHGHNTGDTLLREVATTIRQHSRTVDTVARLGGDEFAILFPKTNTQGAKHVLDKIQRLLTELVTRHNWPTTFSMGVVTFSEPPASAEEMMGFADKVMYSVKKRGKNNIAFESWPDSKMIVQ